MANKKDNNKNLILVIKYFEKFALPLPGVNDRWPRWGVVTITPDGKMRMKVIERAEAKEKIAENGLVEYAVGDPNERIYDTPDRAFHKRYAGRVPVPNDLGKNA